ncbi:hypothetical protein [Flavobacterium branchiophilum]|uniref:hypothetical protein n=1 Tax=Flavobacterium branchiophilum TaxID=55197 RepID=UPI0039F04D18
MSGNCLLEVARMRDRARHHVLVIARRQKKEAPPEGFGAWGLSFFWRHALMVLVFVVVLDFVLFIYCLAFGCMNYFGIQIIKCCYSITIPYLL